MGCIIFSELDRIGSYVRARVCVSVYLSTHSLNMEYINMMANEIVLLMHAQMHNIPYLEYKNTSGGRTGKIPNNSNYCSCWLQNQQKPDCRAEVFSSIYLFVI